MWMTCLATIMTSTIPQTWAAHTAYFDTDSKKLKWIVEQWLQFQMMPKTASPHQSQFTEEESE